MEIIEIIKDAFVYPANDIGKLAIYIVISVVISGLLVGGILSAGSNAYSIVGIILFICALILGFVLSGYQISVVKSGISLDDNLPEFQWKEDLITGIKNLIVTIVYYLIPAIIMFLIAAITNVPGNIYAVVQDSLTNSVNATVSANVTAPAAESLSTVLLNNLFSSLAITAAVSIVVFIIFAFIQTMATARLAKTGSLGYSLNFIEAFKDIGRIGYGKVIAVVILVAIISIIINFIIGFIASYVPQISVLSLIITPYLVFFSYRATGLLYSHIS